MKRLFTILFLLYVLACTVLYFAQDRFIFNPEHIPEDYNYRMGRELEIPIEGELTMNCLLVSQEESAQSRGVIMYLHGNRGSIRFGIYQIRHMRGYGYDIMIPDYRSYGKTEGQIKSEKQLYRDVQKAYDHLKKYYDESNIILVGYSLGTGMASYLAAHNNPAQLILIAPFTSLTDIKNKYLWFMPDLLLKYKLPVKKFLDSVNCPVTIVHGERDKIVDFRFSEVLSDKYSDKVRLVRSRSDSHRSIIFAEALRQTLTQILG